MYDYEGIVQDLVLPDVEDAVWIKPYKELEDHFTVDSKAYPGSTINKEIRVAKTSNVANYDRSDVDPVAGTQTIVKATWNKVYTHTAVEVHSIDIKEAKDAASVADLMSDAVAQEANSLWQKIYENVYAQLRADLLNSGTYSDAALSRATYTALALYNEVTDTPITTALVRGLVNGARLNKAAAPMQAYELLIEPATYAKFALAAQQLNSWVINDAKPGVPANVGWQPIGNFEGTKVSSCQGMTTGDVFYFAKPDVHIVPHRALELETVPSGRDSIKIVMRVGVNLYTLNVWRQGMMLNKD